jgi:methionyl-tRNA formyltransferase
VKRAALQFGLTLAQPERLHAGLVQGRRQPDVGVVAAYGRLIGRELLQWPTGGLLGVHPSLLPRYRGAAPVAWALLEGATRTGVTIFRLNERLDAGDIAAQREVTIEPGDDARTLTARLAQLGAEELIRILEAIETGGATWRPQDESQVSLSPKLTKAQGRIDWSQPAEVIARLVRAVVPWPCATTQWQGRPVKIWSVSADPSTPASIKAPPAPGTVVEVTPEAMTVAAGSGVIRVKELQSAGRRRMPAREFLAGHPVRVGDQFGP